MEGGSNMNKTMIMFDDESEENINKQQSNQQNVVASNHDPSKTMIIEEENNKESGKENIISSLRLPTIADITGWLVATNLQDKGEIHDLTSKDASIGRGQEYDISLLEDKAASRKVCAIIKWNRDRQSHSIVPFEVANASYLNRKKLVQETILKSYDIITVGRSELLYINPFN